MPQHFLDSSALLKRYRAEIGSQWIQDLSSNSDRLIVARLAHVEIAAAIIRRGGQSAESSQKVFTAVAALDSDMSKKFHVVEFSDPLIFRAIKLAKAHALRAADAIHSPAHCCREPNSPQQQNSVSSQPMRN